MSAALFKQRSTRTGLGLFGAMLGLVLFAMLLHGFGLPAGNFDSTSKQLTVLFPWGEVLGALFAALLGAMSITGEIRHGTIRPTFLVTPWRRRVVAAKVWASMLIGTGFGLVAGAVAAGVGTTALRARGIDIRLDAGDYALLVAGARRRRCGQRSASVWAPSFATRCRRSSASAPGSCSSRTCWSATSPASATSGGSCPAPRERRSADRTRTRCWHRRSASSCWPSTRPLRRWPARSQPLAATSSRPVFYLRCIAAEFRATREPRRSLGTQ